MKIPDVICVDFETEAIVPRGQGYPPRPVGFSIKFPGDRRSRYMAWGHSCENNCNFEDARRLLGVAWRSGTPILAQNQKFDYEIATTFMGMPPLQWAALHDTLFLLFLHDPHAESLSLKPAAAKLLGMPPEERDVLKEWILANVPEAHRKPSQWGAYIARAPGKLVGEYSNGDVIRTERLFKKLYADIVTRGMLPAYDRERRLMPILLECERQGVRCDVKRLEDDYGMYSQALATADIWLRKQLKTPELNLDADREVGEALAQQGVVTEWSYTKTGQRSVSKKNLSLDMFHNRRVALVYGYRQRLQTCLGTFMVNWLEMARAGSAVYNQWNSVRSSHGNDGFTGARTGRLSSTPNWQNLPRDFHKNDAGYEHPAFLKSLPPLPLMRRYFVPDKGDVWGKRDYAGQEIRVMAHFENGQLLARYNADPKYDLHNDVKELLREHAGLELTRNTVKILNFQDLYGGGVGALALSAGISVDMAKRVKVAKRALMPDFAALERNVKQRARSGLPIRTWGGREYYCEPPSYSEKYKRVMDWSHKMLNYLIQGSAADCTKQAICDYVEHPQREARFMLSVHDELCVSLPKKDTRRQMAILRESMEGVQFDLKMLTDGSVGPNWAECKEYRD